METKEQNGTVRSGTAIKVKSIVPKRRQDLLRWDGWGYKDSKFVYADETLVFTGNRYPIGGAKLPYMIEWVFVHFNVNIDQYSIKQNSELDESNCPKSLLTDEQLKKIEGLGISFSVSGSDRAIRSHSQTLNAINKIRRNIFTRIPDVVIWPTCHDDVVKIVEMADAAGMVIIPFGGGTSVSTAVECPDEEKRSIISLDTSQMNSILWVDHENLVACCESGIVGQDLDRELKKIGYTMGHEPDSYEFSTLGGWVATRASGMKKNTYGNIEDLLVHVRMVSPRGVLEKGCRVPRISCGPDFEQLILGSEGSLGVITEVAFKIRPLPKCVKYGSVIFPDFESGVKYLREVAKQRCQPSSIRLLDNSQFQFGYALRTELSYAAAFAEYLKFAYLTKIKGFDRSKICLTTLLYEGDEQTIAAQEKKINEIAVEFGGLAGGSTIGERGYLVTFVIAYIRDVAYDCNIISESFETSVPWDRTLSLCRNVLHAIDKECKKLKVRHYMASHRVTQTYDAGCCVYFYFAFNAYEFEDPINTFELIEEKARDEIIASGGSISHHHGVGKLRRKWYKDTVSEAGIDVYRATKAALDPNNVFANANLCDERILKCKL